MTCSCCATPTAAHWPRRRLLRLALALGAVPPLAACDESVGFLANTLVPEDTMAEIGQESFRQIAQQTPVLQDQGAQRRIQRIGQRILSASDPEWREWQFVVFDSDQINAFALPGGRVGIYRGMLEVAEDDDQLAAVIGHEVGHVNARHAAERLVSSNLVNATLRLVAVMAGGGESVIPPELIVSLGGAAADIGVIKPFSRSQELEADSLGVRYMDGAGYEPQAAVRFWQRMDEVTRGRPPAFLSTHPAPATRIQELEEIVAEIA